jgi:hypothetical protein
MKIVIVVLSIALIAAIGFGISQENKSEKLATELMDANSLAAENSVALTKQVEELKAAASAGSAAFAKQVDDLKTTQMLTNAVFVAQAENLQAQIIAANDYAQKVKKQLDTANATIAQLAPQAARARTLPLYVTWRRAWTGDGMVLQVHSTSGSPVPVAIEANNATFGTKTFNRIMVELPPLEIGAQEGWDFTRGDTVKISSVDFDAQTFTCQ